MRITWVPFVVVRQGDVWRRVTMASVVAILDVKGKPLIQRSYRDDVDSSAIERFLPLVLEIEEEHGAGAVQPCMTSQGVNYMHVRHNNLYRAYYRSHTVLALSRRNSNAAEILLFLHKLASVLEEYFKQLEEESIRDNFVILYELLDEMMDFGYPQTTESKILQEYVCITHLGILPRNRTSSSSKCDRLWPSPMPSRGGRRASGIARMKCFWTWWRVSTF